ncbi:hypothetical protein BZA77DRAFT_259814 [Pyronema omphalodes]|nr:hypothetical protein BZA77DRAFT_259814 [Pyronema omphalodes]
MTARYEPLLALLAFCLLVATTSAWTVTSYRAIGGVTRTTTYDAGTRQYTYTGTYTINSALSITTPPPDVTPISTSTESVYINRVTIVRVYLPASAFTSLPVRIYTPYNRQNTLSTYFHQPVVWTAPTTCNSIWTYTTYVSVTIPSIVLPQITPISTALIAKTRSYASTTSFSMMWLVPEDTLPDETSAQSVYYNYYASRCQNPDPSATNQDWGDWIAEKSGTSGGESSSGSNSRRIYDDNYNGYFRRYTIAFFILVCLVPILFILGWFENYFWFTRLMKGKGCFRGGTICWACIFVFMLCFIKRQKGRDSSEERKALQAKWKAMKTRERLRHWRKNWWRWRYPEALLGPKPGGHVPVPVVQTPEMVQTPVASTRDVEAQAGGAPSVVQEQTVNPVAAER